MIYVMCALQNAAALAGLIYLAMNDHPWFALLCILFACWPKEKHEP